MTLMASIINDLSQLRVFAVHGEASTGFASIDDFDLVELDECKTLPEMVRTAETPMNL